MSIDPIGVVEVPSKLLQAQAFILLAYHQSTRTSDAQKEEVISHINEHLCLQ